MKHEETVEHLKHWEEPRATQEAFAIGDCFPRKPPSPDAHWGWNGFSSPVVMRLRVVTGGWQGASGADSPGLGNGRVHSAPPPAMSNHPGENERAWPLLWRGDMGSRGQKDLPKCHCLYYEYTVFYLMWALCFRSKLSEYDTVMLTLRPLLTRTPFRISSPSIAGNRLHTTFV